VLAADQHPGLGMLGATATVPPFSPAWISASYAPVFTASPPFVATSHQSRLELSYAFADVYPMNSRCFPSGDQIG